MTKDEVIAELEKSVSYMKQSLRHSFEDEDDYDRDYLEALGYALSYVKKIAD